MLPVGVAGATQHADHRAACGVSCRDELGPGPLLASRPTVHVQLTFPGGCSVTGSQDPLQAVSQLQPHLKVLCLHPEPRV